MLARNSVKALAARLVVRPAAKTALNSMAPRSQSSRTRTNLLSAISRRSEPLDDMTMPRPAMAAAMAPSLPAMRARPSTRIELVVPSFRKDQVGLELTGPTMMEWEDRSAGDCGFPNRSRYFGEAAITRGHERIARVVAMEPGGGPRTHAPSIPLPTR